MLIDWFTVGAQTLNFIILVWLMKRFLYKPILNAIDAREKIIADDLASADKVRQDANEAKAEYERKNQEFDKNRSSMMDEATMAADTVRQKLLEDARKEASKLEEKRQNALENKIRELHGSISNLAQREVFAMASDALNDLADTALESQVVTVFLRRLNEMNQEESETFRAALKNKPAEGAHRQPKEINVRSSSTLSAEQQDLIASTLEPLVGKDIQLNFDSSPDLIAGIELDAQGFKIGWSIAEYLHCLEDALAAQINKEKQVPDDNASIRDEPVDKSGEPETVSSPI